LISYLVVEILKCKVWNTDAGSDGQCDANVLVNAIADDTKFNINKDIAYFPV